MEDAGKDFFISYTGQDRAWAEWIAWCLEQEHYSVVLQAWDFPTGSNFVHNMDEALKQAERVIAVLSPNYLQSKYAKAEWMEAFRRDPLGEHQLLLPVRIHAFDLTGLLGPIVYIDLVDCDEQEARRRLITQTRRTQPHPAYVPFPKHSTPTSKPDRFPGTFPPIWNIPYQRNPFFTGRDDILQQLSQTFRTNKIGTSSHPQAISGLGGIGKTQIAVEFAYRYHSDYRAALWARAETREALVSDFIAIAELLNLSVKNNQDERSVVNVVHQWLRTQTDWLLILDNADNLKMARAFIPTAFGGHILLTTRAQSMGGLAQRIEIEKMKSEEGMIFLLRRANIIDNNALLHRASASDQATAKELLELMDGLPLALDQAGAYIEETACSLSDYVDLYRTRSTALLKRRGGVVTDHPQPVATTWSLSFEQVEKENPAAAELLRLCAFLNPDGIPEEIITEGAPHLGPILHGVAVDQLTLNEAIEELRKFSLVHRNAETKTLTIHRLVQAMLKDGMTKKTKQLWEKRAEQATQLLLTHLCEVIDDITYETYVKRLIRVLGRYGGVVVARAAELSRPAAERSARLRSAAINILGGTNDQRAVEPLIARLSDTNSFICWRAVSALIRLGPELTLARVILELEHLGATPVTQQIHMAVLAILERFLSEQKPERQLTTVQYQRTMQALLSVLTSDYAPDVQQRAKELLVREAHAGGTEHTSK